MTKELLMAAMKPRTGDGPMEVAKEGRVIVMRVPLEGGGRLVVALNSEEAADLGSQLTSVAKTAGPTLRPIQAQ
jgi:hypothetical protein